MAHSNMPARIKTNLFPTFPFGQTVAAVQELQNSKESGLFWSIWVGFQARIWYRDRLDCPCRRLLANLQWEWCIHSSAPWFLRSFWYHQPWYPGLAPGIAKGVAVYFTVVLLFPSGTILVYVVWGEKSFSRPLLCRVPQCSTFSLFLLFLFNINMNPHVLHHFGV